MGAGEKVHLPVLGCREKEDCDALSGGKTAGGTVARCVRMREQEGGGYVASVLSTAGVIRGIEARGNDACLANKYGVLLPNAYIYVKFSFAHEVIICHRAPAPT